MENRHQDWELRQMQGLPLALKVRKTQFRIREWYDHFDGEVYLSFSGGKDSTVLQHIIKTMRLDIPSVFVDTGLEYPEVRKFAIENADVVLKPEMNFRQVLLTYGYPVISKEVSKKIYELRNHNLTDAYKNKLLYGSGHPRSKVPDKWLPLISAPFGVSSKCCDIMKKRPFKKYEKETGKLPIIATMACESYLRQQSWMRYGCNVLDVGKAKSRPMSFWNEEDVLEYLIANKVPFSSIYGEIKMDKSGHFYTSGLHRTGCMFCAFGAQVEKCPNRFQQMQETHPKQYDYCMRPVDQGGLGMAEVLNYIGIDH